MPWVDPGHPSFYARGEAFYLWTKADQIPVLITTGPALVGPGGLPAAGVLGTPGTQPLYGGSTLDHGNQSGFRLTFGWWSCFGDEDTVEFGCFYVPHRDADFQVLSPQYAVIARPFYDLAIGAPSSQLVAYPGLATGTVALRAPSELWGLEANYRSKVDWGPCSGGDYRLYLFAGPRYLNFEERIAITDEILPLAGAVPKLGYQVLGVLDRYQALNQFLAGQVGAEMDWQWGAWSVEAKTRVGLGVDFATLNIIGIQAAVAPNGAVADLQGGLLALPSNVGVHQKDRFAVVPEVTLDVGYQLTCCLRAFAGYNFLWASSVVRPGEQIDTTLNSTNIPTVAVQTPAVTSTRPAILFHDTTYWAQGLTVGLEFRY